MKHNKSSPKKGQLIASTEIESVKNEHFYIAGIGASAGGLDAFSKLLAALPEDAGMAYVLVQHLDPQHKSDLSSLLAKTTRLPILEATQGMKVLRNHIYVIPPDTSLTIKKRILQLAPRSDLPAPYLTIDHFLRSLADDQQEQAIGIILSGTGTDGTQGLEEIKAVGGITFAQDEITAQQAGMPQNAVRSGCVDFILSPHEIALKLSQIRKHPLVVLHDNSTKKAPLTSEEEHYKKILALLRASTGVDFSAYRDTTIKRRIMRRTVLHTKDGLEEYVKLLEQNPAEVDALYHDLLINVTSFFRDPDAFEILKTEVFPALIKNKKSNTLMRIWVPGCSTGQEAYSLAIVLLEYMDKVNIRLEIQIFATDLSDQHSLRKAREGVYPQSIEAEVSPERLRRFFTKEEDNYRINKRIREMCIFAKHNVAADPPFSRLDLISCRNLLIYLSPLLQRRVIPTFHYALNPEGFLLLGASETVGTFTDLFAVADQKHRIYKKKTTAGRQYQHFNAEDFKARMSLDLPKILPATTSADWQREAERIILGKYAPAGLLVNDNLDILQFHGRTSPYLEPAAGEPSHNLLRMTCEGLFPVLHSAIEECRRQNVAVRRQNIRLRKNGETREVNIQVLPVKLRGASESCFLILFEEMNAHTPAMQVEKTPEDENEVTQLRQELASLHEYLQSVIQQKDTINEEMKSANEEILSSNEELQSTNEEIETAKEELQSVNEELSTINEQLQQRNQELQRLNDDLVNLQVSAGIPIIVIGYDLQIRRLTQAAVKVLDLSPNPAENSIATLKLALDVPDLERIIKKAVTNVQIQEREIRDKYGFWHMLRVHPYRTMDNKIDGAVITTMDINDIKNTQKQLIEERNYTQAILDTVRVPLLVLNEKLQVQMANPAFYKVFLESAETTENRILYDLGNRQWDIPELRRLFDELLPQRKILKDYEVHHNFKFIGPKVMLLNACQIENSPLLLLAIEDISERKALETELKQYSVQLSRINNRKNEFLAMLAHELRNPLAPLSNALNIIRNPGITPEVAAQAHEMMQRQLQQMVRLVDDLLDISRITSGKIELQKEPVELAQVIHSAAETSHSLIKESVHTLAIKLPEEPLWLEADAARMIQIFSNLLNNAAKYTKKGGHIQLSAQHEGNQVSVRIQDNGIGISAEMLPHIFDMFTQVDSSLERAQGGLGIGLALVKTLVELHGGTVKATSKGVGHGAEFIVQLPLILPLRGRKNISSEKKDVPPLAKTSVKRVLVVDDNEASAKTMGWMIEMLGHEVRIAHDGANAITIAKSLSPDMVLLDIGLPGMNGYKICRALRQEPVLKNTKIIALTGWGQKEHRLRSKKAGFDYHIVKPLTPDMLQELLNSLEQKETRQLTPAE